MKKGLTSNAIKLIAISLTLMVASQWMGGQLIVFTNDIFANFPLIAN